MLKCGMKILLSIFALIFIGARAQSSSVQDLPSAMPAADKIVASAQALGAACPTYESLSQPWVEHNGSLPEEILAAHLSAGLDHVGAFLLPIDLVSWWVGSARRGRGDVSSLSGCFARGSAAFYFNGLENEPAVDIVKVVAGDKNEKSLRDRLIELRWYDAKDGRKHRWYNLALAKRVGWTVDGRGKPSAIARPIPLPQAINELN
jgi:hypothetical protein